MFLQTSSKLVPSSSLLPVFVCVLALVANGDAIKCFVCDSSDNASCLDLKSNTSIVPEECSLDKMKSIDTWLFELNKISYFDTGASKSPLMNCQKVVARDPSSMKMVTARFCQLDTGDSDACSILRSKLGVAPESEGQAQGGSSSNGRRVIGEEEQFHCSICNTDRCNGSERLMALTGSGFFVAMALIMPQRILW